MVRGSTLQNNYGKLLLSETIRREKRERDELIDIKVQMLDTRTIRLKMKKPSKGAARTRHRVEEEINDLRHPHKQKKKIH